MPTALILVLLASAIVGGLVLTVMVLRRRGDRRSAAAPMLPPVLEEARGLLGLECATGRWTPPACVGEVQGVRVAVVSGARAGAASDSLGQTVCILVDTGLHPGMPSTEVAATGLATHLPPHTALLGGASLFRGSGADLAIRSRWPAGWSALYLEGAPAAGAVTAASIAAAVEHLLELRRRLAGSS